MLGGVAGWDHKITTIRIYRGRVTHLVYRVGNAALFETLCGKSFLSLPYALTTYVLNGGCKKCNAVRERARKNEAHQQQEE